MIYSSAHDFVVLWYHFVIGVQPKSTIDWFLQCYQLLFIYLSSFNWYFLSNSFNRALLFWQVYTPYSTLIMWDRSLIYSILVIILWFLDHSIPPVYQPLLTESSFDHYLGHYHIPLALPSSWFSKSSNFHLNQTLGLLTHWHTTFLDQSCNLLTWKLPTINFLIWPISTIT